MFVIGTAGHVDHGKSLLVEALTGIDPDRLREEKARGMTIDLGFAWLTLPSGRSVSIVDVPGHERFIKNMLAGAGGVDLALLVVAADDGVMPQTREHLAILDLLDVGRGVVALTKRDLVDDDWIELIERDIVETLAPTTLAGSPIVRCSAVTRQGLDDLVRALDAAVDHLPPKRDVGRPRLPIDRVFTISGFGTVVTGTLVDGELAVGEEIEVVPGEIRVRIRGLQSHRDSVERAMPGTRTAVNLAGVAKHELRRGMVLARPGSLRPSSALDVRLRAVATLPHPIRHNMRVTFHSGADEANAQVRLLDADELRAGEGAWAQLRFETPVAVVKGDRFVLRTPNDTIGGGVIVDTGPTRHRRRDARVLAALGSMLSGDPEEIVIAALMRQPLLLRSAIAAETGLDPATLDGTIAALAGRGAIAAVVQGDDERLATTEHLRDLGRRAIDAVATYHRAHQLRKGMPLQELRERLRLDATVCDALAPTWNDVRIADKVVRLTTFKPAPDPAQRSQIDAYLSALRSDGDAMMPAHTIDPEILAYLVETGAIVDAAGVVFDAAAFASMTDAVRAHIVQRGSITLAEARDITGVGRRHAQALLEELDRRRVTRRTGDARVLR